MGVPGLWEWLGGAVERLPADGKPADEAPVEIARRLGDKLIAVDMVIWYFEATGQVWAHARCGMCCVLAEAATLAPTALPQLPA
jgi:hypothetical protein